MPAAPALCTDLSTMVLGYGGIPEDGDELTESTEMCEFCRIVRHCAHQPVRRRLPHRVEQTAAYVQKHAPDVRTIENVDLHIVWRCY